MKIATWNVNSIRIRLDRVLDWLERERPEVLCLQELKLPTKKFPHEEIEAVGYHAAVHGQRAYNGVAILSPVPPEGVVRGMGADDGDEQARIVSADVSGIRVISAYFPNGQEVGTEAYGYKLEWMGRLRRWIEETLSPDRPVILAGDFNVAPRDSDVAVPEMWAGSVLCHDAARASLEDIRRWGFTDVFEKHHPDGGIYSWWDYQMLAFPRNNGLRIDHVYVTAPLAQRSSGARVDREARKKGAFESKPSDHAPVVVELD